MAFIKANSGKSLSVPEIAKDAGYSERYLRNAFRAVLGQSMVGILQAAKIRRAKSLLLETNLGVSDVAYECGFENPTSFAKAFRGKVGFTPSEFRKKAAVLKESPNAHAAALDPESDSTDDLFRDSFPGTKPGAHWKPIMGEWRTDSGTMVGTGGDCDIVFLKPLPENCRIAFEMFLDPPLDLFTSDVSVILTNEWQDDPPYCTFTIASGRKMVGELRHFREGRKWNPTACIKEKEWHNFVLEIKDDSLRFVVNGREMFSFRDSFPPAYAARCCLQIQTWHCGARIRRFVLQNLGFMPASHPIRQGDALYNAQLPEKAMDFYMRLLKSGSMDDAETMELRYKIGMCALQQQFFSAAEELIGKVVALREDKFWAQQARLGLLETYWKKSDPEKFRDHLRLCLEDTKTRDSGRVIVQLAIQDLSGRGFVEEVISVLNSWLEVERNDMVSSHTIRKLLAENLFRARRFDDMGEILGEIIRTTTMEEELLNAKINLMHLYSETGRIPEAVRMRAIVESETRDSFVLARCRLHEAVVLRAMGNFDGALEILRNMGPQSLIESGFIANTKILAAHILCCLAKGEQARVLLAEAKKVDPNRYMGPKDYTPLLLLEENFLEIERLLHVEYCDTPNVNSLLAEIGIKAGIMRELAGRVEEAKEMFRHVERRFPRERVYFFAPFAAALAAGADFDADKMLDEISKRSEMFYFLGLLQEKRGKSAEAKALFEQSLSEDPLLRWPACFSKKKLGLV